MRAAVAIGARTWGVAICLVAGAQLLALSGCEPFDPPFTQDTTYASCCNSLGTCLPSGLIDPQYVDELAQDSCGDALSCVPEPLTRPGEAMLRSCIVADTGAEGRCAPACLPAVAERAEQLARHGCGEHELCVPCFNPTDGEATGVCSLGDDPGPSAPPVVFAPCCDGYGRCLPSPRVPDAQRSQLGPAECVDADDATSSVAPLCVPERWVQDPEAVAAACTVADTLAEGRCLPDCVRAVAERADQLTREACGDRDLCVPCFDPLSGEETGACSIGGDPGPSDGPVVFARCCGALGRCIPPRFVPESQRDQLTNDECARPLDLCVPERWAMERAAIAVSCRISATGAEGRCLPACLPQVAEQADGLTRESCEDGHLCTPCFDPLDGEATGACEIGDDPGPVDPPVVFDRCCQELGRCVPPSLVPEELQTRLGSDRCDDDRALCVPEEMARDEEYRAVVCAVAGLEAEGRCLPECLPEVAERAAQLDGDGCAAGYLCVPCYDPVTGEETGSCDLGADPGPTLEPVLLELCCDGLGRCVEPEWVDSADREQLGRDTCLEQDVLCAPASFAADPEFVPPTCVSSASGGEGRCLPGCLPAVAARGAQLSQDGCESDHLCVPCYDPVSGESTAACQLGGDPGPADGKTLFEECCDGLGRCVGAELVPEVARAQLGSGSCSDPELLCAPSEAVTDPEHVPETCHDPIVGFEGRCLPACLSAVAAQGERLRSGDCDETERCVPCTDPATGGETGACEFSPLDPGPAEAPVLFESCCDSDSGPTGLCVPEELLPPDQQALPPLTCDDGWVCAPRALVESANASLPQCSALTTDEGACLPECMLGLAEDLLVTRGSCDVAEQCVPCTFFGESTGACQ